MIYLYYGKDSFRSRRALIDLRDQLAAGDGDMLASNTTVLDGANLAPGELLAHATAVPFLASARLVIVEGLIKTIGEGRRGRRKKSDDDPLEPWRQAAATLRDPATMPDTTTLVFLEPDLDKRNAAFPIFAPIAKTLEFGDIDKRELPDWISEEARRRDLKLSPRALAALAQLVGSDLWTLSNELDKLATYARGDVVEPETVAELVSSAQETKVWELTDGIVAGDERKALTALSRLLTDGQPAPLVAFMIVRQFREIAVMKDMRERRLPAGEIAKRTGMKNFRIDIVSRLADRFTWPQIRHAYALLLDADLNVKRGLQDDESSLQLVVHQLCALAPRGAPRRAYAR